MIKCLNGESNKNMNKGLNNNTDVCIPRVTHTRY